MLYIILSILCSVTVAVLLKLAKRKNISIIQAISWNYFFALIFCFFTFKPDLSTINQQAPWNIYITLGILLPTIFLFLAASVKHIGIVKTDIAQRLSLFIPIIAAYFIFKESFNILKILGIIIGFLAIFFTLSKKNTTNINQNNNWFYPVIVLLGFGCIDVLFKQIALYKNIVYTTSLFMIFGCAFIVAISIVFYQLIKRITRLKIRNFLFGSILGLFNFGNILFYLKAHKVLSENPSTVFAAMNMGVIVLGSCIGILFFKEKMSRINYIGIILALISIIFITLSQIYSF